MRCITITLLLVFALFSQVSAATFKITCDGQWSFIVDDASRRMKSDCDDCPWNQTVLF